MGRVKVSNCANKGKMQRALFVDFMITFFTFYYIYFLIH